jgi:hypothetical protein
VSTRGPDLVVQAFADNPERRAIHAEESFVSPANGREFIAACAVYDRAVRDLGPPPWIGSVNDLLCDNMSIPLERARELAELVQR